MQVDIKIYNFAKNIENMEMIIDVTKVMMNIIIRMLVGVHKKPFCSMKHIELMIEMMIRVEDMGLADIKEPKELLRILVRVKMKKTKEYWL